MVTLVVCAVWVFSGGCGACSGCGSDATLTCACFMHLIMGGMSLWTCSLRSCTCVFGPQKIYPRLRHEPGESQPSTVTWKYVVIFQGLRGQADVHESTVVPSKGRNTEHFFGVISRMIQVFRTPQATHTEHVTAGNRREIMTEIQVRRAHRDPGPPSRRNFVKFFRSHQD